MNKRKPNRTGISSSNRERVVKNDYYYACRKKSLIKRSVIISSAVVICGTFWYIKEVPVKAEVQITDSVIEWKPKKDNLKGITFQVFKDGNMIHETKNLKFVDKTQKDTGIPSDIDEIETFRSINGFKILWKVPRDKSSENKYQVFATNRLGLKVFKTEEVLGGEVSGIDKYIIRFKGKEFESNKPEFNIDTKDLKAGTYTIDIKSIDRAGNESEFKTFAFDFNSLDLEFKNGKLIPKDSKYTNDNYNFYIIDEELVESNQEIPQYDKKMFLVNENLLNILDSGMKPKMTSPSYTIKEGKFNFSWSKPRGGNSTHKFYVEAVDKETLEKTYSDLLTLESSSQMLGYHYALNTKSNYSVSPTDKYTDENQISIDLKDLDKDEKYYFHVATIDNSGIISDTKTIPVSFKSSNSASSKSIVAKQIVVKTKGLSNENYKKILDEVLSNYSLDDLKLLKKEGIKVHVLNKNFKELLESNYDIKTEKDDCVRKNKSIFYNVSKSTDSLFEMLDTFLS